MQSSREELQMTAAGHSERHWQLVARRQQLRELSAPKAVLERNRLRIVANFHAWRTALIDEHLGERGTAAAA
jgi:hypothetical protein